MTTHYIIGIDPGSRITGYGIITKNKSTLQWITHGTINCPNKPLSQRLRFIHEQLSLILQQYPVNSAAIEEVFTCINMQSALKLGQARGTALLTLAQQDVEIHQYSAKRVKKSVVGYGAAEKFQVQQMVRSLLRLTSTPPADAADALAIAICHAHHQGVTALLTQETLT